MKRKNGSVKVTIYIADDEKAHREQIKSFLIKQYEKLSKTVKVISVDDFKQESSEKHNKKGNILILDQYIKENDYYSSDINSGEIKKLKNSFENVILLTKNKNPEIDILWEIDNGKIKGRNVWSYICKITQEENKSVISEDTLWELFVKIEYYRNIKDWKQSIMYIGFTGELWKTIGMLYIYLHIQKTNKNNTELLEKYENIKKKLLKKENINGLIESYKDNKINIENPPNDNDIKSLKEWANKSALEVIMSKEEEIDFNKISTEISKISTEITLFLLGDRGTGKTLISDLIFVLFKASPYLKSIRNFNKLYLQFIVSCFEVIEKNFTLIFGTSVSRQGSNAIYVKDDYETKINTNTNNPSKTHINNCNRKMVERIVIQYYKAVGNFYLAEQEIKNKMKRTKEYYENIIKTMNANDDENIPQVSFDSISLSQLYGELPTDLSGQEIFGKMFDSYRGMLFLDEFHKATGYADTIKNDFIDCKKFTIYNDTSNWEFPINCFFIFASNKKVEDLNGDIFNKDFYDRFSKFEIVLENIEKIKEFVPILAAEYIINSNNELTIEQIKTITAGIDLDEIKGSNFRGLQKICYKKIVEYSNE